jgi:hypothetical protein
MRSSERAREPDRDRTLIIRSPTRTNVEGWRYWAAVSEDVNQDGIQELSEVLVRARKQRTCGVTVQYAHDTHSRLRPPPSGSKFKPLAGRIALNADGDRCKFGSRGPGGQPQLQASTPLPFRLASSPPLIRTRCWTT